MVAAHQQVAHRILPRLAFCCVRVALAVFFLAAGAASAAHQQLVMRSASGRVAPHPSFPMRGWVTYARHVGMIVCAGIQGLSQKNTTHV
mgnify:CR=1 FL=1